MNYPSAQVGANNSLQATATAPAPPTLLFTHIERVREATQDVHDVATQLHEIADRLFGVRPTAIEKDAGKAQEPPYSFGRLDLAHEQLLSARSRARDALDRLRSL